MNDPLWLIAFPIYYLFMLMYGAFATVYYLPQIRTVTGNDPTGAQLFGVLIMVACFLGFGGSLINVRRGSSRAELAGHLGVVGLMVFYFLALCYLVGVAHDPGTRPGSIFVPTVFAVFPAVRVAVIVREWRQGRA